MKPFTTSLALVLTAASAFVLSPIALANDPIGSAPAKAISISGTQCVHFDYGTMNWVGTTLLSLGGQAPKVARCVATGDPGTIDVKKTGAVVGTESFRLVFLDGSGSFDVVCRFQGTPGATPGLLLLHEVGAITNGTDKYAGASGVISIQGPYLSPFPIWDETDPAFVGELHGEISGLKL